MKVSIITATYNSAQFLADCIESVIHQDYPHIEHIIIDGKSKDKTVEVIQSYDDQINKWISEPDIGIYDAINKGIRLATGDIVGILNSDDFFADPGVISRMVKALQNTGKQIVFADVEFIDRLDTSKVIRHYSSKYFRPWLFRFGFQPAHPTFYTYRANFEKYGFYRTDLKIAGDFELLLRFIYKYKLLYSYENETWVRMRIGGASTSGIQSILKLNTEIVKACKINGVFTHPILVYSKYLVKWWGFIFNGCILK